MTTRGDGTDPGLVLELLDAADNRLGYLGMTSLCLSSGPMPCRPVERAVASPCVGLPQDDHSLRIALAPRRKRVLTCIAQGGRRILAFDTGHPACGWVLSMTPGETSLLGAMQHDEVVPVCFDPAAFTLYLGTAQDRGQVFVRPRRVFVPGAGKPNVSLFQLKLKDGQGTSSHVGQQATGMTLELGTTASAVTFQAQLDKAQAWTCEVGGIDYLLDYDASTMCTTLVTNAPEPTLWEHNGDGTLTAFKDGMTEHQMTGAAPLKMAKTGALCFERE